MIVNMPKIHFMSKNPSVPYLVTQAVLHPEHDAIFRCRHKFMKCSQIGLIHHLIIK